MAKYTIGVDFGTECGRAVVVRVSDGVEVGSAVHAYADGVIEDRLPHSDRPLPPQWALQNPDDYIEVFKRAVPEALRKSGVNPAEVIGIGVDFTSCTMLPVLSDGTPLCRLPEWRDNPHAWVKLWKHHAAQGQADRINATAREMGEKWLQRYGGKISSEWFFPKTLQILEEAPEVYRAADRLIEAADWVVWQLCGVETRNTCTAGYKAMYQDGRFPRREFFATVHPELADVVDRKMRRDLSPPGTRAGGLTAEAAQWTGLRVGTCVAVANVDAHVTLPAAGVVEPNRMLMIMGTSICHILVHETLHDVPGICGVVLDGVLPGTYGYEAGQNAVGDMLAWFVKNAVPPQYHTAAERAGVDLHTYLAREADKQAPGEHGLLALDWWNGNRSVLVDANLSGLILGCTLATRPEDIYRALIEGAAFGTRLIIETFETNGVPVLDLIAAGGLPEKNDVLMRIFADVTGREIRVVESAQAPALGSAIHAAVAAGAYPNIRAAAIAMGRTKPAFFEPSPENKKTYDKLYAEYVRLHDHFGRGENDVMKRLLAIRLEARGE